VMEWVNRSSIRLVVKRSLSNSLMPFTSKLNVT